MMGKMVHDAYEIGGNPKFTYISGVFRTHFVCSLLHRVYGSKSALKQRIRRSRGTSFFNILSFSIFLFLLYTLPASVSEGVFPSINEDLID